MNVWKCLGILFWSTEASWARIADGKSLYHLGLIFGATVLYQLFSTVKFWSLCPFPIYFLTNRKICSLKLSPSFLNKVFQKYLEMNVLLIKEVLLSWSQNWFWKHAFFTLLQSIKILFFFFSCNKSIVWI